MGTALRAIGGIERALIYGSWAARAHGVPGPRPVGDIDVLVLGDPDRDRLYAALEPVEHRLGRPVQVTIRNERWLESGTGSFHDTIVGKPMVDVDVQQAESLPTHTTATSSTADASSSTAIKS